MDRLSTIRRLFRELSHWYLCVVLLLLFQLLTALFLSFAGPSGAGLERLIESAYVSPANRLGNTFFEEQMVLGNAPLGMGLFLLIVIIYSFLGGTTIYLIWKLSHMLRRGNHAVSLLVSVSALFLLTSCGKSESETPKKTESKADSIVFTLKEGIEFEMIRVQPGTYTVGVPRTDPLWRSDIDRREVTVSLPYWLGRYEVTQEQWEAVMSGEKRPDGFDLSNPSLYKGNKRPVDAVTRNDVNRFIEKLNNLCAGRMLEGYRFDLPDPVRWEIACRAGTTTRMPWGDNSDPEAANLVAMGEFENSIDDLSEDASFTNTAKPLFSAVKMNSRFKSRAAFHNTSDVGTYPPNAWGFCDMIGNVAELCRETHTYSGGYGGPMRNKAGKVTGELPPGTDYYEKEVTDETITHGGSWLDGDSAGTDLCGISPANSCWHPYYDHAHPEPVYDKVSGHHIAGWKESCIGFRLALVPIEAKDIETVEAENPDNPAE